MSTVSTVTTASMGLITAIGVSSIIALIWLLMAKEITSVSQSGTSKLVARFCDVGILPLTITFAVTTFIKVVEILS